MGETWENQKSRKKSNLFITFLILTPIKHTYPNGKTWKTKKKQSFDQIPNSWAENSYIQG